MGESARKSRLLVAFFFLNLFFSSYSFAQAAAPSYAPPACPNRSGCETTQLSSADVSNLWKILFDGNEPFSVGQEIEGGSVTGKTAAVDEFTSTDSEGDHAKDENFPNKEISPLNHWLSGNQCNGPFSYALRVVDDVRVAQCKFSTDAQGKECEGVYGLKAAGTVNEAADALGLDVAEQYQTKGNTVLSGTFNSKMICASNEDNCDFTLFSDYEKAFNFTTSVVDVSSIVLPLSAHLLQSKIFGDRSILFYLGLQGETPRRIPILSEFIKRNYPDHINKKNQQLITEKFASFSNPIIKDTYGTGDVILATHNTALNANIIKSLEEETLKLEQLVKKNPDLGEAYQDLINNYRSSISFVKSNVRSAIAGPEKAKFQAGGGYLTKGNITVTPQEWTRAAIKKPGVADEAIAAVHDFKSLERTLGVDDLYNWQANLNVDDIWKKVTPGELTPAQMAELGITDPSVIAQGYVRKKVFGDELSDGLSGRGTILVGDPNFSVQPWGLLDNNPRVEYFKKSTQTKELWRAMSDDQQWMTESLLNYDAGWRKSWQDTFKGFRDGGYIRSLPSEGLFTTTFIPRTEAGQAAKALVEKANQYVGKPFYHVFLQPTGVLIRRSGGAEILGLPTELFGWAAAYRIPKTWHVFEAKPGKNPDEPEHDIYKDAYLDLWFNKKNDNGILLEKWFFNVTAQLGENLPFVGGKVEDLRNKKERIGHTGDGLIWQTTVDWTTPRGFESLGNEQFFSITPDPQEGTASVTARAPKLRTIALEDTKTEDKDKGPVIMAFYHHTDLKGKVGTDDGKVDHKLGTGVDLKAAIDSDNECAKNACARNWFANAPVFENVNISFATLATATNNNLWPLMGVVAGPGGGPATFIGFTTQAVIGQWVINAYCIDGCIDTSGGYYVTGHLAPEDKELTTNNEVAKEVTNFTQDLLHAGTSIERVSGEDGKEEGSPLPFISKDALQELDKNIKEVVGGVAGVHPKVMELQVDSTASKSSDGAIIPVHSELNAYGLYSVWLKGLCNVVKLAEEEKTTTLQGVNGKTKLVLRQGPGNANLCVVREGGKEECLFKTPVEEKSDKKTLLNMAAPDVPSGVFQVPQKVVKVSLSGQDPVIKITTEPQKFMVNSEFFNCAKDYAACSGAGTGTLGLEDISSVVGKVNSVITDDGHSVFFNGNSLSVNGPKVKVAATPKNAFVSVNANGDVTLTTGGETQGLGKIAAITTTKASFLRDATSENSLLFWLRELAKASTAQITGLDVSAAKKDCATGTTGFNFNFGPDPSNAQAIRDVDALNKASAAQGPKQIIETEDHIYYLVVDDLGNGNCSERLRVIDKRTGKAEDFQLTGPVQKIGPNEFLLPTDKGDQKIKLDEDNGKVFVSVNDGLAEVVSKLVGKGGTLLFDPDSAVWKALNAQTIPLIDAIKQGLSIRATDDGRVVGGPGTNIAINVPGGAGQSGFFQLPWWPENPAESALFAALLLAGLIAVRTERLKKLAASFSERKKKKSIVRVK